MLLFLVSFILISCLKTNPKQIEAINHWIGDKESIQKFLDSPYAQSDRWVIEALR